MGDAMPSTMIVCSFSGIVPFHMGGVLPSPMVVCPSSGIVPFRASGVLLQIRPVHHLVLLDNVFVMREASRVVFQLGVVLLPLGAFPLSALPLLLLSAFFWWSEAVHDHYSQGRASCLQKFAMPPLCAFLLLFQRTEVVHNHHLQGCSSRFKPLSAFLLLRPPFLGFNACCCFGPPPTLLFPDFLSVGGLTFFYLVSSLLYIFIWHDFVR